MLLSFNELDNSANVFPLAAGAPFPLAAGTPRKGFLPFPLDFTLHSYDYISLFEPFVNITVSLGSLFQRIAFIDDRFYFSCLDQLFEEN